MPKLREERDNPLHEVQGKLRRIPLQRVQIRRAVMRMPRPHIDDYFMEIAHVVAKRATCRRRNIGAILVKDKQVLATGYNGAPAGCKDCLELGCLRDQLNIPSGTKHEICRAVHAEQNAIIQSALHGVSTDSATMYVTVNPCVICAKMIVNAKVRKVIYEGTYPDNAGVDFLREAGVIVQNVKDKLGE